MGTITVTTFGADPQTVNAANLNALVTPIITECNGSLDNTNIKAAAGIVDTKLAQITTASKVHGSAITGYTGVGCTGVINVVIGNRNETIATGIAGDLYIPFACNLTAYTMLADQTGSVVVDIWAEAYADYPPTNADSMCAAKEPTITTAVKSQDTNISDWTTVAVAAGDTLRFNVDSCTSITQVCLALNYTRT